MLENLGSPIAEVLSFLKPSEVVALETVSKTFQEILNKNTGFLVMGFEQYTGLSVKATNFKSYKAVVRSNYTSLHESGVLYTFCCEVNFLYEIQVQTKTLKKQDLSYDFKMSRLLCECMLPGKQLFILGEERLNQGVSKCYILSIDTLDVEECPSLASTAFCCVYWGQYVYAFGEITEGGFSDSCYRFSLVKKEWEGVSGPPNSYSKQSDALILPNPLSRTSCVAFLNEILVTSVHCSQVFSYFPYEDSWKLKMDHKSKYKALVKAFDSALLISDPSHFKINNNSIERFATDKLFTLKTGSHSILFYDKVYYLDYYSNLVSYEPTNNKFERVNLVIQV